MRTYRADTLIDGTGTPPRCNVDILVDDSGKIFDVRPAGEQGAFTDSSVYTNPGATVMPGFVDVHTHLMFGEEGRSYKDVWANDSDGLMLLRGPRNAFRHLQAGVTTLRDCGAVRDVGFDLREGARAGYFVSPRMLVCGRPLTITGGHFWWCGQEADGPAEVRAAVRQLLKQGADFLKIMCDGGRPDDHYASFSLEELSAAVEEIHRVGKRAVGHCEGAEAIARAVEAGLDEIEHINFLHPDGTRRWNQETADEILRRGVYVCPTIQTGWRKIERLKAIEEEQGLSPDQQERLDHLLYKTTTKADFIGRFHDMGVPIVAGTDAIARFGDYAIGLRLLHAAGLSKMETVLAATSLAAEAIGMGREVGSVEPGKYADLVYIDGDPLSNLRALSQVETVVLGGEIVVEGHGTDEDDGGGIDYVERVLGDIKAH